MTAQTILTIQSALKNQLKFAEDNIKTLRSVQSASTLAYYEEEAERLKAAINGFEQVYDADYMRWLMQAEEVKQHLLFCREHPGAKITITVESDNGQVSSAELYDHAALVQSLYAALDDFQSEL